MTPGRVDLEALKQRNDRGRPASPPIRLDRKTEELIRIAAYVAMRNPPHHIQIHVHPTQAGAPPEEIQVIDRAGAGRRCTDTRAERDGGCGSCSKPGTSDDTNAW